ncbi:MAG: glycosyltransferase family 2 protein, partial [Candidatus Binatia bacterium]
MNETTTARRPRVSVVMPVLKPHPDYFPQAVESVLGQTLREIELLIVEDPSDRPAAELLSRYADPRIRHFENPTRTSLVEQRNRGIEEARAPYVAFLDSDDVCEPARLEKQLAHLEAHPEIDVLGSQLVIIDGNGAIHGYRYYP